MGYFLVAIWIGCLSTAIYQTAKKDEAVKAEKAHIESRRDEDINLLMSSVLQLQERVDALEEKFYTNNKGETL